MICSVHEMQIQTDNKKIRIQTKNEVNKFQSHKKKNHTTAKKHPDTYKK